MWYQDRRVRTGRPDDERPHAGCPVPDNAFDLA